MLQLSKQLCILFSTLVSCLVDEVEEQVQEEQDKCYRLTNLLAI